MSQIWTMEIDVNYMKQPTNAVVSSPTWVVQIES